MKKQNCMHPSILNRATIPLLRKIDIEDIFNDGELYEMNSFFIIDKNTKTYDVNIRHSSYLETAEYIRNSYLNGHTVVVKNLEKLFSNIRWKAATLGRSVDVHMYLVPPGGDDSFDFHEDDRHVLVHMCYGTKIFTIKDGDNEKHFNLDLGDELYMPHKTIHKATPNGPSCLLSFGIDPREYYKIYGGIRRSDL